MKKFILFWVLFCESAFLLAPIPTYAAAMETYYSGTVGSRIYKSSADGTPYNGVGFLQNITAYFQDGWAVMIKTREWHAYSDNWQKLNGSSEVEIIRDDFLNGILSKNAGKIILESDDWKLFFQAVAEIANTLGEDVLRNQGGHIADITIENQPAGPIFKLSIGGQEQLNLFYSRSARRSEVLAALDQRVTSDLTDSEKAVAIQRFVCELCDYNSDGRTHESDYYDIISGSDTAVCLGYAEAYELLMNHYGIETHIIRGYLNGNLYHAWNVSRIDGKWLFTDVTINDTSRTER